MKKFNLLIFPLSILILLGGCKAYKQDIMFKLDDDFTEQDLSTAVNQAERNYVIQVDDLLSLEVYTNDGERIVDPNNELQQSMQSENSIDYLVKTDGTAKFPIVGQIKVDSLTLDQAELLLQKKYDEFYKQSFVKLTFNNKRVVVLGAVAGGGQTIPLVNENVSLIEILALAGGFDQSSKAQNIKVIRGNLSTPEVYQIDLSTVSGMKQSMLDIEPGDVIYVEPWKQPFIEGTKDITPILSLLSSTLALVLVLQNL